MLSTLVAPAQLADFIPLAERALAIEPASMIRFRAAEQRVAGFVRLPYDVLAGRTLATEPAATEPVTTEPVTTEPVTTEPAATEPVTTEPAATEPVTEPTVTFDITVAAADFLRWAQQSGPGPAGKDAHWLSALPPRQGWRRVEVVPDSVIRDLVRSGAELATGANSRQSQEALLASVVLTVTGGGSAAPVQIRLGALSALTRMGFLPRDSEVAIDVSPGWIRVAAAYGSTYVSSGNSLGLLSL